MSTQPQPDNTLSLPAGWSVQGTRYGSQTDTIGNIVQGYTFIVQLPSRTQIQVFVPRTLVTNTDAVRQAIMQEGASIMAIENL